MKGAISFAFYAVPTVPGRVHVLMLRRVREAQDPGMYVRDRWFPASYATATWGRLAPFFALRGRVRQEREWVQVELRPFNDRALNRDLAELCTQVAQHDTRLPDGRRLIFAVGRDYRPYSDA